MTPVHSTYTCGVHCLPLETKKSDLNSRNKDRHTQLEQSDHPLTDTNGEYTMTPQHSTDKYQTTKKFNWEDFQRLHLIRSDGNSIKYVEVDMNIVAICLHPVSGSLYCGFSSDSSLRELHIESGDTTKLFTCHYKPACISITRDHGIIVASDGNKLYKYDLSGVALKRTTHQYGGVRDISECALTRRIALACGQRVVVLDRFLIIQYTCTENTHIDRLNWTEYMTYLITGNIRTGITRGTLLSVAFDIHGNLLIGDFHNNEIFVLHAESYEFKQKLDVCNNNIIMKLSQPREMKLYSNILWVTCQSPCVTTRTFKLTKAVKPSNNKCIIM